MNSTYFSVHKGRYDLSIIVVSWNAKEFLRECLNSLYETIRKVTFDVWVIDNDSSDGSPEMVKREFPKVNLICTRANLGFAEANNIGVRKSNSRYVCLVNPDVKVLDGCIDLLCAYTDQHPQIGIVGPKILNPDLTLQPSAYGFPTPWNSLTHALGLHKIFPQLKLFRGPYRKYWPYDTVRNVDVLSACFWVVRREALDQVGLLDKDFFMYKEDFDLCRRFGEAGWYVVYFPEAQAVHYGGGSSSNAPANFTIEGPRAQIQYWKKHHGKAGAFYISLMIFIYHMLCIIQGIIWCIIKPSNRMIVVPKIKKSFVRVLWLLTGRVFS